MKCELHLGDCLEVLKTLADNSIDLTVTSPPYDNLRNYNGSLNWSKAVWENSIQELFRVTKEGGVVVWVVGDATVKGSETGSSFKQALFAKRCGFRLYDTMIWNKAGSGNVGSMKRYQNVFEYMFIFSKGAPQAANIIKDKKNKSAGSVMFGTNRDRDGTIRKMKGHGVKKVAALGRRHNVWQIFPCLNNKKKGHPAPFPEKLARDHVLSWSNEGDLVLDPFCGSATTGVAALKNGRHFVGIEKDPLYFKAAKERLEAIQEELLWGLFTGQHVKKGGE